MVIWLIYTKPIIYKNMQFQPEREICTEKHLSSLLYSGTSL